MAQNIVTIKVEADDFIKSLESFEKRIDCLKCNFCEWISMVEQGDDSWCYMFREMESDCKKWKPIRDNNRAERRARPGETREYIEGFEA